MDFVIGGLAGAGATVFTNPMDVVKTRLQLQGELKSKSSTTPRYKGIFHALYVIGSKDGAMALQKGLASAMLLGFTMNSIRLGTYHVAEVKGWTRDRHGDIVIPKAMLWASLSGAVSGVCSNPASVVKTRLQAAAHPSIAVGRQHKYEGTWHAFKTIYNREGVRGLFAGTSATCTRIAIGSAAQLTTFSSIKECLTSRGHVTSPHWASFVASVASGAVVVVIEAPLDIVNTRLMNQGPPSANGKQMYSGILDCMQKIYRTEGMSGLYKGVLPLYLRIAPHTTLSLVIWDMLNNIMMKNR